MTLTKKTVLITGCAPGGIGNALAREFHARGLRVFATARSKDRITDLAQMGMETLSLDVTSTTSVETAKAEIAQLTGGTLDYLVNNAGRSYPIPAIDVDMDEVQQTFDANVFGVIRMCQAFAPLLVEARGTIVQVGSVTAIAPVGFSSIYNATKAALSAYSDTLRIEVAPFGVKVITLITGGVKSRLADKERHLPAGSLYHPIESFYQMRTKQSQQGAMPTARYAALVVSHVLRPSSSSWYWLGSKSTMLHFVYSFFPRKIWDFIFPRMYGFTKLAAIVAASKKNV